MSEIATHEIQGASPVFLPEENVQEKVRRDLPFAGFGAQGQAGDGVKGPSSHTYVLEITGFQVAAFAAVILFVAISFTLGLTTGRSTLVKRLWDAQKSVAADDAPPPALPNRPGETASQTSFSADKFDGAATSEKNAKENVNGAASAAKVVPTDSYSTTESRPTAYPAVSPERKSATEPIARSAPPLARLNPAHSPKASELKSSAPKTAATRRVAYARSVAPHASEAAAILVRGPGDGSKPFRLTLPEKPIAASSTFAMTSQLSVVVSPEPGLTGARQPARLQAGELVSFVWPRYPIAGDRYGSSETVKVRTTIGTLGQVEDVKLVSGSASLLPAAINAIRQWRYKPTLVNERPVQAQEDVTIEFRR
jgi:TonB family protein